MTNRTSKQYTYEDWDGSLEAVCARFKTNVATVRDLTADVSGESYQSLSEADFSKLMHKGFELTIPYAGDDWEWRAITLKTATLGDFCKQDADNPGDRAGGPPLDPKLLYLHIMNAWARSDLMRNQNDNTKKQMDEDPTSLEIPKGYQLLIPYPIRVAAPKVGVTPSAGGKPSGSLAMVPDWASQLEGWQAKINKLAHGVNFHAGQWDSNFKDGYAAVQQLAAMQVLVSLQVSQSTHAANTALLKTLESTFASFYTQAQKLLSPPSWDDLKPAWFPVFQAESKQLKEELESDLAKKVADAVTKNPQEKIGGNTALAMAWAAVGLGYAALLRSTEVDSATQIVDAAIQGNTESVLGKILGTMKDVITKVGLTAPFITNSVGNIPGPSSIWVALLIHRTAGKFSDWMTTRAPDDVLAQLKQFVQFTAEEEAALKAMSPEKIREVAASIGKKIGAEKHANTQAGVRMTGVITLLNMACLAAAMLADPGATPATLTLWTMNVSGGTMQTASGMIQFFGKLSSAGELSASLGTLAKGLGVGACAIMIVSGVLIVITENDRATQLSGALQAVGGAVTLAGFFMAVPGLQVAGGVLVVASAGVALYVSMRDANIPGAKKVLLAQLDYFAKRPIVGLAFARQSSFKAAYDGVVKMINADDHGGLYAFRQSPDVEKVLADSGFAHDDILAMEYVDPSMYRVSRTA